MKKYYTGIGSRDAPKSILKLFKEVAIYLGKQGYLLRSGASVGCDTAFENGCDLVNGDKEIYLPWFDFNNSKSRLVLNDSRAYEIAKAHHPCWGRLSQYSRMLLARNTHQVLGNHCSVPSDFVICYTKNGSGIGGTGQTIRVAKAYNVPVFDYGHFGLNAEMQLVAFLKQHERGQNN